MSRERFRAGSVKIMQDGIAENHTAAILSPRLTRVLETFVEGRRVHAGA
ncbi:hypothetical protein ACF09Y_25150 [Streptomyces massasporeus]